MVVLVHIVLVVVHSEHDTDHPHGRIHLPALITHRVTTLPLFTVVGDVVPCPGMQTATASYYASPLPAMHPHAQAQTMNHNQANGTNGNSGGGGNGNATLPAPSEPLRTSVSHLLARAYNLPCTAASQAFTQLVQPTARFQLALDALLPLLTGYSEVSISL